MAHSDYHLLRSILDSGDLQTPLKMGISETTFLTQDGKIGFQIISQVYNSQDSQGHVMGLDMFRQRCPVVANKLPNNDERTTVLDACRVSLMKAQQQILSETLDAAIREVENVHKASEIMRAGIDRILSIDARDRVVDFGSQALQHVFTEYSNIKKGRGVIGYRWPDEWNILNERTGGIEKGMYVLIHGRPGNMKSYILCNLAVHFLKNTKLRVYFFNNEMTTEKLITRLALIYCGISSRRYRKGLLTQEEEIRLMLTLRELHDMTKQGRTTGRIAISDPGWSRTVPEMGARLLEHRSHICLLDGAYLMHTESGKTAERPEFASRISREIQRQCISMEIPHLVTTQTGRKAEEQSIAQRIHTVDNIGYTDAWGQDAAFVIAVMLGKTELTLLFPKVREDEKCPPITIHANPGEDFSYKGDYISSELYQEEGRNGGNRRQNNANPGAIAGINVGQLQNQLGTRD